MALNKLYYIYGLDTSCFYTDEENHIEQRIIKARHLKSILKKKGNHSLRIKWLNDIISASKQELLNTLSANVGLTRNVRMNKVLDAEGNYNYKYRISIFDGDLTRCFGLKEREFNTEIIIVKVYFFEVAHSILSNGFYFNGNKYVFFSASAGQIRTKKFVAVREDLLNKYWNTLTCGLTIDEINRHGGVNVNKFLAYLALCNSGTDKWESFDIDKTIVVGDFKNKITGIVDYIDDQTFDITRQEATLPMEQIDGCGMMLPCVSDRNFMVRLPFVKGLLAVFDFRRFIQEHNASPVVVDIYGKEHNVVEEDIQIIFSESQFKMWKYYKDWEHYKENFKKYHCTANKCNIEEDVYSDASINYQMIQTLYDLKDNEIRELADVNDRDLRNVSSDIPTMMKFFGAVKWNKNKGGFEKCLEIYPELLMDKYSRRSLLDLKNKEEKDLWSARFKIKGKYTFVIPDLYAFCEWLFLKQNNPQGLLKANEVCCRLFHNGEKLDCLRSPHLYIEHPVRVNNTTYDYFQTNAIYISCQDFISRIVQCDFDGDKLLVCNNKTLVQAAERNTQDIVPLYYYMHKANAEIINSESLYKGLITAYTGGNIGEISNAITKIWNSGDITPEKLKVVKWLVYRNNEVIDFAKTLYKAKMPEDVAQQIKECTKDKTPFFFRFAKGKTEEQTMPIVNSTVNRIYGLYPKRHIKFNFTEKNLGVFDYKMLMRNPDIEVKKEIIDRYKKVIKNLIFKKTNDEKLYNYYAVFDNAKVKIVGEDDIYDVTDMIIKQIFHINNVEKKKAFWIIFGDIVFENLQNNLEHNSSICVKCGKRFLKTRNNQVHCDRCVTHIKQKYKIIKCIDCGKDVKVLSHSRTTRCEACGKKERQRIEREKKRKQRLSHQFI